MPSSPSSLNDSPTPGVVGNSKPDRIEIPFPLFLPEAPESLCKNEGCRPTEDDNYSNGRYFEPESHNSFNTNTEDSNSKQRDPSIFHPKLTIRYDINDDDIELSPEIFAPSPSRIKIDNASPSPRSDNVFDLVIKKKMTRSILYLRIFTLCTLVIATAIIASLTYKFIRDSELQVFQSHYKDLVDKVDEIVNLDIAMKLNIAKSISDIYTSRYGRSNQWPNVTMPDFQRIQKADLLIANAIAISFNPIITNETRSEWEAYAVENVHILNAEELVVRQCESCRLVSDGIFRGMDPVDDSGYSPESRYPYMMVPVWQICPMETNWKEVMYNLHSDNVRARALDDMLEYKVPTITGLVHRILRNEVSPSSILFHPVFSSFDQSSTVVGSISIYFTWANMLRFALPGYIKGLYVILDETSDRHVDGRQQYTYKVSGNSVNLIGEGDLHESEFDNYQKLVMANVTQDVEERGNVNDLITYTLKMYPSKEFQQQYLSTNPLIMSVIVVSILILTSCAFILYDFLVHLRQKSFMKFAQRSGGILNSMYPSNVHERLFSSSGNPLVRQTKSNRNAETSSNSPADRIKLFLTGGLLSKNEVEHDGKDCHDFIKKEIPPIADLFHNTTVMFADIVSFTEWSANHCPEDVFCLLETLFFELDNAAERRGVFKVGTIGEIYRLLGLTVAFIYSFDLITFFS